MSGVCPSLEELLVVLGRDRRIAACFDVRDTNLDQLADVVLLGACLVYQAPDGLLREHGRAVCPSLGDLPLDHALKLVR